MIDRAEKRNGSEKRNGTEKSVTVRIPEHLLEPLKEIANREGRSQNAEIVQTIIKYLNDNGYTVDMLENRTAEVNENVS